MSVYKGTFTVKTPTNTARYGLGELICDNSLVLRGIPNNPAQNPISNYFKIYVDSTNSRLRVKDSVGIPRNVGVLREQLIINQAVPGGGPTVFRTIILNGSNNNGVPTRFSVAYTAAGTATLNIRVINIIGGGTSIGPLILPNATNSIASTTVINASYPVADGVATIQTLRSGGSATIHSILIEY
jgi:hypothetical protein